MCSFCRDLWQIVLESNLLNLIGAAGILIIGWGIALWLSRRVSNVIRRIGAGAGFMPEKETADSTLRSADTAAGRAVYCIIMLFAVLGCFSVLKLNAAAEPLQTFLSAVTGYLPHLIGALLLAAAARITAGIVRAVTRSAMRSSSLAERLTKQKETMAEYTASALYYTVWLFFLPAILNALKIYGITQPLQAMFEKILTFLPRLLTGAAIFIAGLWAADLVRKAVTGLAAVSRLNAFGEKLGVSRMFGKNGLAGLAGITAYILIAIPVTVSGLTALQIPALTRSFSGFLDKLLNAAADMVGAGLILFLAVLLGGFAASLVTQLAENFGFDRLMEAMGFKNGGKASVILGRIAYAGIIVLALLAACDTLGFKVLADLLLVFAAFAGNVLLSIVVLIIGIWLASFAAGLLQDKCSKLLTGAVRAAVIIFTAAIAVGNMNIGGQIVETAFALILGAVCVASAIAFGIGGREAAGKLLNQWADNLKK